MIAIDHICMGADRVDRCRILVGDEIESDHRLLICDCNLGVERSTPCTFSHEAQLTRSELIRPFTPDRVRRLFGDSCAHCAFSVRAPGQSPFTPADPNRTCICRLCNPPAPPKLCTSIQLLHKAAWAWENVTADGAVARARAVDMQAQSGFINPSSACNCHTQSTPALPMNQFFMFKQDAPRDPF